MLALRLLWRNWRSGEVKLLAGALLLAVAVVSGIAIFTDRLQRTLVQESNVLLGADRVVRGSHPHNPEWEQAAKEAGLSQTTAVHFASMVYAGEHMHLASVKAVGEGYPVRGQLETSLVPFAIDPQQITIADGIPAPGEAWVDSRLLPLLNLQLGDRVAVGEYELTVTRVLIREPDSSNPFSFMGARLLMNQADLPLTEVVQPGSRVQYQWLYAGRPADVEAFSAWLEPQLNPHQRLVDVGKNQQNLGRALATSQRFLLLAAVIGVLLASVALALSARQFANRHVDQVALLKSLGASSGRVRRLYFTQLFVLAVLASLAGLLVGEIMQRIVEEALWRSYQIRLGSGTVYPYLISLGSGLICLLFFALPALWFLPYVPPMKILRRELTVGRIQIGVQVALAFFAILLLVLMFSQNLKLAASVIGALVAVLLTTALLALGLLRLSRSLAGSAGSVWRLAVANLQRRREQTLMQIVVFSVAIMLLLTLTIVRTSLLDDWQAQLPDDAPNHFLVNIPQHEVDDIQQLIDERHYQRQPLYPMVRGRLTHINGVELSATKVAREGVFNREANLTWTADLADDNKVVDGNWWPQWQSRHGLPGVSVEVEMAREADLKPGDRLTFSLGGLAMEAEIASLRSLDWRSMRPNFFFIFEPGALDQFSPTYITSLHLPPSDKAFINDLLQRFPTVLVIELDRIFEQIRTIVTNVSDGVQLVLLLTLAAGCLVLLAAVTSSIDSRKQEVGLLRALGSPRRLMLGSVWLEFSLLGLLSGLIAVLGAEILLASLQHWVLETPIKPHYWLWLTGPLLSALLIGGLGVVSCRPAVNTPPAVVLREAG
ncbi:ABC transporter permease [Saccharophagus sp. K07]|uniref:ABC transporter permease n=1 Tax=Saccharophagus sp. K07 TaxID=2283636 RepID=UPI00165284AA|nr:FtsX-like permease family protein [Saccharophagus sp. K07]MBC6905924.1 ABC transporter permease [Saccharophagus sp. K07]